MESCNIKSSLVNLGNTCYQNSIYQLLGHTPIFREYILENDYVSDLQTFVDEDPEEFVDTIIYEFHRILKTMWSDTHIIKPTSLKKMIDSKNRFFRGYHQHDSQEFLNWFLDTMHEEIKTSDITKLPWTNNINNDPKTNIISLKAINQWNMINSTKSIITNLFTGLYSSSIKCENCGFISYSFDPFMTLTLDINNSDCTLENCFDDFIKSEQLDDENKITCQYCCTKNNATKNMSLYYCPKILIIHLKRFEKDVYGNNCNKKENMVYYPLTKLKLKNYMSVHSNQDPEYQLYGVNIHSGDTDMGHYYSYVKNQCDNRWYNYNDDKITHINKVQTSEAYMLFYYRNN